MKIFYYSFSKKYYKDIKYIQDLCKFYGFSLKYKIYEDKKNFYIVYKLPVSKTSLLPVKVKNIAGVTMYIKKEKGMGKGLKAFLMPERHILRVVYPINKVDYYVTELFPGVYILSKNGKTAAYVGRSDYNVASRVKQSVKEGHGYKYFWFEYASSAKNAYYKECQFYHHYEPPDNTNHPSVPPGQYWRCPQKGCPWS